MPGGQRIRILHISDLHARGLRDGKRAWKRKQVLGDAWRRNLDEIAEDDRPFDLVTFTGDVADRGLAEEYTAATPFVMELLEHLHVAHERFFVVPGNHDVHRDTEAEAWAGLREGISKLPQDVSEWMAGSGDAPFRFTPEWRDAVLEREREFWGWVERDLDRRELLPQCSPHGRLGYRRSLRLGDQDVYVMGLDSAWLAGDYADAGKLWLTDDQLGLLCKDEHGDALPGFRLALVHHPLSDLADAVRAKHLLADSVDLLLRGHQHTPIANAVIDPDRTYRELAAGCLYEGSRGNRHPNACQVIDVTLDASGRPERYDIRFRAWSPDGYYWHDDSALYREATQGRLHWPVVTHAQAWPSNARPAEPLKRPAEPLPPSSSSISAATMLADGYRWAAGDRSQSQYRAHIIARYRQAAAAYHGTVRFLGMPKGPYGPHSQVHELFVPLGFVPLSADPASREHTSTAELAARLVPELGRAPGRFVILGGPGSGKSTLCQYLAVLIAGEERLDELTIPDDVLPLLIRLRDYVTELSRTFDLGLVAFLERQARRDLSLTMPEGFLDERLAAGRAVLLLDGLDEVGSPEHRATLRDRVQAFCRAYPTVPTLVTSRNAGYQDAPLASQAVDAQARAEGFVHLRTAPFSDDDLRLFIDRWYKSQIPDESKRLARVTRLWRRLINEPRARALADRPLLATLLAMVHDHHGELPGERTRIYELCVEMLLETWPARRDRQFAEIDAALQQFHLEALALAMQWGRDSKSRSSPLWRDRLGLSTPALSVLLERHPESRYVVSDVMAPRQVVLDALAEILNERGPGGVLLRDRARRWLDFLTDESGILHEQRPGMLGFCHLTFMEYLAARALQRAEPEEVAAFVSKEGTDPTWNEVCLLMLGIRANDRNFLDHVFRIATVDPGNKFRTLRWHFLLEALEEEVDFRAEQREQILRGVADRLLGGSQRPFSDDLRERFSIQDDGVLPLDSMVHPTLARVQSFSRRHGREVTQWIGDKLTHGQGEELLRALALDPLASTRVQARNDGPVIAPRLIELWPGTSLGGWAVQQCPMQDALPGVRAAFSEDLTVLRACAAFVEPAAAALGPALAILLAHTASRLGGWASSFVTSSPLLHEQKGPADAVVSIEQVPVASISIAPQLPFVCRKGISSSYQPWARFFLERRITNYARVYGGQIASLINGTIQEWFSAMFSKIFGVAFIHDIVAIPAEKIIGAEGALEFAHHFITDFPRSISSQDIVAGTPDPTLSKLAADFSRSFVPRLEQRPPILPPDRQREDHPWLGSDANWITVLMPLALEAYAALALATDNHAPERVQYVRHRIQHRFLLEMWPAWEATLSAELDTHRQTLYLALGWTQCTVTATWPGTPRWTALLGGAPPAHWLARAHWHLCWLVFDPEDAGHLQGYRGALAEGRCDDELPGYADEMPSAGM